MSVVDATEGDGGYVLHNADAGRCLKLVVSGVGGSCHLYTISVQDSTRGRKHTKGAKAADHSFVVQASY